MILYLMKLAHTKFSDSINLSIDAIKLAIHFKGLASTKFSGKNESAKIAKSSVSLSIVTLR